jgi:general L-amino acid transport system permease protein
MSETTQPVKKARAEEIKPPVSKVGVIGWIRSNLFDGWLNSLLTLLTLFIMWQAVPPFVQWAFIDSNWISTSEQCRESGGACWSIIPANIRFITFGFPP